MPKNVYKSGPMRVLTSSDIADLREKLGMLHLDLSYVLGRMYNPQKNTEKVTHIKIKPLSYLIRLLMKEPDLADKILITWPSHTDAYNAVARVWDAKEYGRLSDRKFSIICGVTPWTYAKWCSGDTTPSASTLRLFKFLCDVIHLKGREGLELYLECVDEDAKSRGISEGLKGLMRSPALLKKVQDSEKDEEDNSEV